MASEKRERSVGRRISSFFTPGNAPPDSMPPPPLGLSDQRPVSRGRPQDASKLRKSSLPFHPASSARHTPSNSGSEAHLSALSSANHSAKNSVDAAAAILPPPRPPFAANGSSSAPGSRSASPARSRNVSPHPTFLTPNYGPAGSEQPLQPPPALAEPTPGKISKRRSWFPGAKDKPRASSTSSAPMHAAWIAGHNEKLAYDVSPLVHSQPLPELWNEAGDTFIHLFPQASGRGPSFRVHSAIIASSITLTQLAFGDIYTGKRGSSGVRHGREASLGVGGAQYPPKIPAVPQVSKFAEEDTSSSASSRGTRAADDLAPDEFPKQINLYVPILSTGGALSAADRSDVPVTREDIEALIAVRNMFAFLVGQSIVATEKRPTVFSSFLKIADSLLSYGFTNLDGSTFGEVASLSFDSYIEELELADVRASREKTIEALVLGERMRSVALYNEAFIHAVGKYSDIVEICKLPEVAVKYNLLGPTTRNRMERAAIDLSLREKSINTRLADFNFPSIFAGILDSKTADERKQIRFGAWKDDFFAVRKHVLSYYKDKYGSWPPKASSKKNNLETSGLNRLVLQDLYEDFADLYDLYVDRTTITARTNNAYLGEQDVDPSAPEEPVSRVLWRVFDEYDRSHPPVQPPVPFDLPLIPALSEARLSLTGDSKKDTKVRQKKLSEEERLALLNATYNADTLNSKAKSSPFLQSMLQWERKIAKGCNMVQLADHRASIWIFCYAVIQALPLLVVDAPGVRHSKGVEYFLCEPPRGGVPWANPDAAGRGRTQRSWYGISGGAGVVSLPSDLVEHGVEGVYRRSHCWIRGKEWGHGLGIDTAHVTGTAADFSFAPPRLSNDSARRSSDGPLAPNSMPRAGSHSNLAGLVPPPVLGGGVPSLAPPGSPHSSRPGTPRSASADRRRSALSLSLEALPMPQGVAPHGIASAGGATPLTAAGASAGGLHIPRSRPVTRDGPGPGPTPGTAGAAGGKSFDAIIADMEADKAKTKGKKSKK